MANMSSAYGEIEVRGIDKKEVVKFWEIFEKTQERAYYGEFLNDEPSEECTQSFMGCGRWTLNNNLDNFGRWAKQDLVHNDNIAELQWLEEREFVLHFDYDEYECGFEILQHESCDVVHTKNTPLDECELLNEDITTYDYNLYGLAKLDFEEVSEYLRSIESSTDDKNRAAELLEQEFNRSLQSAKKDDADIDDVDTLLGDFDLFENSKGEKFDVRSGYKAILSE